MPHYTYMSIIDEQMLIIVHNTAQLYLVASHIHAAHFNMIIIAVQHC